MYRPFTSFLDDWLPGPQPHASATSKLEYFPNELLDIIFPLACTDGGRTGCNLALVSKSIRATSRASRFHSVSLLCGLPDRLEHFLRTLDAAKAEARAESAPIPCVRHLCISLTYAWSPLSVNTNALDAAALERWMGLYTELSPEALYAQSEKESEEYHAAFLPLLNAVRTDLESLCLLRESYTDYPKPLIACPGGFPRLREFTFNEGLPPFLPPDDATPMYPALERLHMSIRGGDPPADFHWWAANAPRLTWLRINAVYLFPLNPFPVVSDLARVIGPSADEHSWKRPNARLSSFSQLQTLMLMVHPAFLPPEPTPQVAAAYAATVPALDAELRALGVPCTVYQSHYDREDTVDRSAFLPEKLKLQEGMRRDWLLRTDGAQGLLTSEFWTESPGVLGRLWKAVRGG